MFYIFSNRLNDLIYWEFIIFFSNIPYQLNQTFSSFTIETSIQGFLIRQKCQATKNFVEITS